jgi:LmbE family N-acetylglucosaminyl deacetylase
VKDPEFEFNFISIDGRIMNVLVVTAHHDDLELGCGGTVANLIERGHRVISLVMTHSGYDGADGTTVRSPDAAREEGRRASETLGYELIGHDEDTFDIPVNDRNICRILDVINENNIDTVFTHWHGDTHPPHRRINEMVLHSCRRVPRVLGFAVNWYIGEHSFSPRLYIAISESQWEKKIKALRCYESEFRRTGAGWVGYLDNESRNYGTIINAGRAEGFMIYKFRWDGF